MITVAVAAIITMQFDDYDDEYDNNSNTVTAKQQATKDWSKADRMFWDASGNNLSEPTTALTLSQVGCVKHYQPDTIIIMAYKCGSVRNN